MPFGARPYVEKTEIISVQTIDKVNIYNTDPKSIIPLRGGKRREVFTAGAALPEMPACAGMTEG
ncbi:hypothetical protein DDT56_00870 [Brenneria corticis]|uniref:Uncharacterized protein n=1 Tax=Brenneria corticis TaxID=2173106 RepID=A0A2U1UD15_9GAMM|nr:hypothetical protein DDT56_00870 [Brenneria sp. CFCC 11842]